MTRPCFVLDRRMVLRGLAASAVLPALAPALHAQSAGPADADALLLILQDLHSPYARLPAILSEVRAIRAESGGAPMAMILNGDLFERGNAIATRSGAAADWRFLTALAAELPVYVNLGNHETAILDDMAGFVARATGAGLQPISNLMDTRTGRFFAPTSARIGLGGIDVALLGVATTNPFVYREQVRDTLGFLNPEGFVQDAFADATAGADLPVLVSHAGVAADKTMLPHLPAGALALGAHDHLRFETRETGQHYIHGGSWGTGLGVVGLRRTADGIATDYTLRQIAPEGGDPDIAAAIAAAKAAHMTPEDAEILAEIPDSLDMHGSILVATDAVRAATDADVAVLGHTTFGAPLAAGPMTRLDFDAFVRFGGAVAVAEITGTQLAGIVARGNQFAAESLEARTGDYVHVAQTDIDPSATYRLATNGWTAMNQASYLGTRDVPFETVDGMELKAVIAAHLATL